VLLSSHILAEVETLCDRVTIIRQGRTVRSGALSDLRHLARAAVSVVCGADAAGVSLLPGVHDVRRDGGRLLFSVEDGALPGVLRYLLPLDIRSLTTTPPTLEELFLHQYSPERSLS
jgi:ABC-2 type transport system ATP-binding protein